MREVFLQQLRASGGCWSVFRGVHRRYLSEIQVITHVCLSGQIHWNRTFGCRIPDFTVNHFCSLKLQVCGLWTHSGTLCFPSIHRKFSQHWCVPCSGGKRPSPKCSYLCFLQPSSSLFARVMDSQTSRSVSSAFAEMPVCECVRSFWIQSHHNARLFVICWRVLSPL